jgi:hypothetical protein
MNNAVIYYGAPPKGAQQTVSESLRLKGIHLVKSTVRNIMPDGVCLVQSPSYQMYVENIQVAMASAISGTPKVVESDPFTTINSKRNLEGFNHMRVVFDINDIQPPMDPTALSDMKTRFSPAELSIHDKPAFQSDLNITQLNALKSLDVSRITPTVSGTINIQAALILIRLQRLALAFLNTHQYALVSTGTAQASVYSNFFKMAGGQVSSKVLILTWVT